MSFFSRSIASCLSLFLLLAVTGCGGSNSSTVQAQSDAKASFVYVTDASSSELNGYSVAASSGKLTSISGFPVATGSVPMSAVANPKMNVLYVANSQDRSISVFGYSNSGSTTLVATHALASQPFQMATSSNADRLFVLMPLSAQIAVFPVTSTGDLGTASVLTFVSPADPTRFSLSSDNSTIFASDSNGYISVVTAIDTALTEVSGSPFAVSDRPIDIACCDGSSLYIADFDNSKLVQYAYSASPASLQRVAAVSSSAPEPYRILLTADNSYLLVATATNIASYALDVSSAAPASTPTSTVTAGSNISFFVLDPAGGYLYSADQNGDLVYSIAVSNGTLGVVGSATSAGGPSAVTAAVLH